MGSTGVISMIDLLIKDLEKELTEATTEEKDSQADYAQLMKDAADKRTTDSMSLSEKQGAKADTESALEDHKGSKEARAGEVDSLKKAKAVLSGADYSLVQMKSASF